MFRVRTPHIALPLSLSRGPFMCIIERMSDTHPTAVVDDSAVPIPANARALFAKMAAFNDAKHAAEVGELQTVRELCLAYNTVDEDAFGEAAEQLTYHGAQGTPPAWSRQASS